MYSIESVIISINGSLCSRNMAGPEDISGGNLKLILGMMWTLIRRYQIGSQSKLPPKKMMLFWVNAVLHPHKICTNFTTDWNDGLALL